MNELMHPSWADTLADVRTADIQSIIDNAGEYLNQHPNFLPAGPNVLRAFSRPMDETKVVILGQDPYPTPGHAVGLSFSVDKNVRPLPKSLNNIFAELQTDLGIPPSQHGDLSHWFEQGVLLLNRCLTVTPGQANSHKGLLGWEEVTEHAIERLCVNHHKKNLPLIGVLWGAQAQNSKPIFDAMHIPTICSPHPSPLSAYRGFFGSRPFSQVNNYLVSRGTTPIYWQLPQD